MRQHRRRACSAALILSLLGTLLVLPTGCEATTSATDTNTNWLKACAHSGDCTGGLDCLCGICTTECSSSADCREAGDDVACIRSSSCAPQTAICTREDETALQVGPSAGRGSAGDEAGTAVDIVAGAIDGSAGGAAGAVSRAVGGAGGAVSRAVGGAAGAVSRAVGGSAGVVSGGAGGVPSEELPSAGAAGISSGAIGSAGSAGASGDEPINPIVGTWHEEARYDCATGAEVPADPAPINEIVFGAAGTFSVTWTPFEWYEDYEGTYVLDLDANTIDMTISTASSNYVPADTDLSGSIDIDTAGNLILQDIWFGIDQAATVTPACGHRLAPN